jgi:hypothetical protein
MIEISEGENSDSLWWCRDTVRYQRLCRFIRSTVVRIMDNGLKTWVVAEYRQLTGPVAESKESSICTDLILRNSMQFYEVLMAVHHSWSRSLCEPHMSSLFTLKITMLWGVISPSPRGRTVRDATTFLGSTRRTVVNLWTQRVRTNFIVPEMFCFSFYLNTKRWVKPKALTATVTLDCLCSLRLLFAGRVKAQDARRMLKHWNWERLKNNDRGSKQKGHKYIDHSSLSLNCTI